MTPTELEAMLARDAEAWRALSTELDARPDEPLHGDDSPAWKARDVYNHVRRWMDRTMDELEAHLAGQSLPDVPGTEDEINARWQQEDAHFAHAEARKLADEAYARRERLVRAVRPEQWDDAMDGFARGDGFGHLEAHHQAIRPGLMGGVRGPVNKSRTAGKQTRPPATNAR